MDLITRRCRGIVREFDKTRGYGTIQVDTGEEVSVRYSAIVGEGLRVLRSGDHVSFDIATTQRGPTAVRVIRD